jgi:hypothetical protein
MGVRLRAVGSDTAIERLLDQPGENLGRVEILLGDGACGPGVPRVIGFHLPDGGGRLLRRGERQDALPHGQDGGEAGVLDAVLVISALPPRRPDRVSQQGLMDPQLGHGFLRAPGGEPLRRPVDGRETLEDSADVRQPLHALEI